MTQAVLSADTELIRAHMSMRCVVVYHKEAL
jgi:hypothetical protein